MLINMVLIVYNNKESCFGQISKELCTIMGTLHHWGRKGQQRQRKVDGP